MIDLLTKYSIQNIIIYIVLLALAVKGCLSFITWIKQYFQNVVQDKIEYPKKIKNDIEDHSKDIEDLKKSISEIKQLINMLIQSDKDDIKAYITREHHYFVYQKGWIDDYSLDCIERRFEHYTDEGGNTFIENLMKELRTLPKRSLDQK